MKRNLDGVYFRVARAGAWDDVCFSDLTTGEMKAVLKDYTREQLIRMCVILGQTIHKIGDELDIVRE